MPVLLPLLLMLDPASQACPTPAAPPPGFADWAMPGNRPGIGQRFDVAGALAVVGETAEERARGGRAAVIEIEVPRAGSYGVALSDGAWIDMVRNGKPLAATGHDHGPPCSGIRKIVRFTLVPGRYQLRLSGIMASSIGVMVAAV
ncbi:MAG: hypothetical protein ACRCSO_08715 [Sphingomonas sp.]